MPTKIMEISTSTPMLMFSHINAVLVLVECLILNFVVAAALPAYDGVHELSDILVESSSTGAMNACLFLGPLSGRGVGLSEVPPVQTSLAACCMHTISFSCWS
jgi:hypothetical protein